jgi:transketolase
LAVNETDDRLAELRAIAARTRGRIIRMLAEAGSGHPGGSLSAVEIVTSLYFSKLRHRPTEPDWPERDRFVISKGHGVPVVYAALAEAGYFDEGVLMTLRKLGSPLQGHPDRMRVPGIEAATGSLGQGLSVALGMALASQIDGSPYRVYCLLGDGECQAGQVWEAAMAAGQYRTDCLTAIIDYNKVQLDGRVVDIMDLEPLGEKWESFNWATQVIDGNDLPAVLGALDTATETKGKPSMIIANTIKGKGVSFMEGQYQWHGKAPSAEEAARALAEIEGRAAGSAGDGGRRADG